ncbi:FkbM family methyltransferase [bacterium AH-315-C20]|nr:FkbM family methyltransferase [bacterium AH-315-C20]
MKKYIKLLAYGVIGRTIFKILRPVFKPPKKLRNKMKFVGSFTTKGINGQKFKLHNQAFLIETNIFWSGLEDYEWEAMSRTVWTYMAEQSNVIFDIGANSGIFAILAKVHNADAKVVAFEPQPNIYSVLKRSNDLNNFDISCENLAVSNENGELPFYNHGPNAFTNANTTVGSLNKDWRPDDQTSILVEVMKLKRYIEENNIPPIDLMKIDVETLEYEVLEGYGDLLTIHQPIILMEVQNPKIGENIEGLLKEGEYVYYNIIEKGGLKEVRKIGLSNSNHNYLLCPKSKAHLVDSMSK